MLPEVKTGGNGCEHRVGIRPLNCCTASIGKSRAPGEPHKVHLPPASCLGLALSWWVYAQSSPPLPAVDLATLGLRSSDQ